MKREDVGLNVLITFAVLAFVGMLGFLIWGAITAALSESLLVKPLAIPLAAGPVVVMLLFVDREKLAGRLLAVAFFVVSAAGVISGIFIVVSERVFVLGAVFFSAGIGLLTFARAFWLDTGTDDESADEDMEPFGLVGVMAIVGGVLVVVGGLVDVLLGDTLWALWVGLLAGGWNVHRGYRVLELVGWVDEGD